MGSHVAHWPPIVSPVRVAVVVLAPPILRTDIALITSLAVHAATKTSLAPSVASQMIVRASHIEAGLVWALWPGKGEG